MAVLQVPQYGQNTDVDGTAEVLTADTINVTYGTVIKALSANTDKVYVGYDGGVTVATGWQLSAGEEVFVSKAEVPNAGAIYVIGGAANQGVCWRAV
jgi:hypothetical protein